MPCSPLRIRDPRSCQCCPIARSLAVTDPERGGRYACADEVGGAKCVNGPPRPDQPWLLQRCAHARHCPVPAAAQQVVHAAGPLSYGFNTECMATHRLLRCPATPSGRTATRSAWQPFPKERSCHADRVATLPKEWGCCADRVPGGVAVHRSNRREALHSVLIP